MTVKIMTKDKKNTLVRGILGNSAPLALGMRSVQGKALF
ncbi:hypothetical protein PH505_cb00200 [Pseudoalteromonas distincta]|nr:hypothetical protein PH505_cb00200 [Pseudoalteromonas distincta]